MTELLAGGEMLHRSLGRVVPIAILDSCFVLYYMYPSVPLQAAEQ
jgi:hypothetical protein